MQMDEARRVLDLFDVPSRLEHVRRYVWRDGELRFAVEGGNVYYELAAHWPAAVVVRLPSEPGIQVRDKPVIESTWVRGTAGYVLRVGIDLQLPSAIYLKADGFHSFVPFAGRAPATVEQALQHDLEAYVNRFLSTRQPVPEARAAAARRLNLEGATPS
jgi:hypothetical protein